LEDFITPKKTGSFPKQFDEASVDILIEVNDKPTTSTYDAPSTDATAADTADPSEPSPSRRSNRLKKKISKINKKVAPQGRQTPMGLPKPTRLNKRKFSVDEIYTNMNYHTPVAKTWETIYEVPKVNKRGDVKFIDKRTRHRAIYFKTNPAERPSKKRSKDLAKDLRKQAADRKRARVEIGDTDEVLKKRLKLLDEELEELES